MDKIIKEMLIQSKKQLEHQYPPSLIFKSKDLPYEIYRKIKGRCTKSDFNYFFWPTASLALALEMGHKTTNDRSLLKSLKSYYDYWIDRGCNIYLLDQTMNGYTLLYLSRIENNISLRKSIQKIHNFIREYPRTDTGSLPYRTSKPNRVLIDYLGMVCPFLSRYGRTFNKEESLKFAINLIYDFLHNGIDEDTGLPYHGFKSDTKEKIGIIGWGRGVGWLFIGMTDTLAYLDQSHEQYTQLQKEYVNLLKKVIQYQDKNGYFKWMLPAKEGHVDTSATSMIGYSIKRSIDLEIISSKYMVHAENALDAVLGKTKNGVVYDSSAECRGVSMYPQRFESNLWGQGFGTAFALVMLK